MLIDKTYALADLFNDKHIRWGLGGSSLLHYLGADVTPRDLDVVIHFDDVELGKKLLLEQGATLIEEKPSNNEYLTEKFYTFKWDDIEIDLMARPGIRKQSQTYHMPFDKEGPAGFVDVFGHRLWLCSADDWAAYYSLMTGREQRVSQLTPYLKHNKKG